MIYGTGTAAPGGSGQFAQHGFEATSTRAVAAAGLSPTLVTRHFGSKQGLREAVDAHVLDRITQQLKDVDPDGDLMAALGSSSARSSARTRSFAAT